MNKEELNKIPFFFIIGRPRSGTTLLSTLFDAHPNVIIPFESPIIMNLHQKYHRITSLDASKIDEIIIDLKKIKKLSRWNIDETVLRSNLQNIGKQANFDAIIKAIYLSFQSFFPKEKIQLFGDKNPVYSLYFKKIFNVLPNAKYIHLIRDYRDNILSVKKLDFEAPLTSIIAFRWKFSNKKVLNVSKRFPENFYFIRYEDLISNPETELKKICAFLGIEFNSSVLNFHEITKVRIINYSNEEVETFMRFHSNLLKPINTSKSGVWKNEMKLRDLKISESIAGKWAEQFNYPLKHSRISLGYKLLSLPSVLYVRISYHLFFINQLLPPKIRQFISQRGPLLAQLITKIVNRKNA